MIGLLHLTTLVITTVFAAGAAVLVNWLLLRATFQLMRPATAGKISTSGSGQSATQRLWSLELSESRRCTADVAKAVR